MHKKTEDIVLPGQGSKRSLKCKVLQSPLAGVSDQVFRRLVRRWAPDALLFTEMVNANSLQLGHGLSKIEEIHKEIGPVGVQLFDYRPIPMAEAARKAEAEGAFLIDINMGCPVKKIARKGGGSGLIKEPELATKIVEEVVKAVKIPVTVKTRLGWCEKIMDPVGFALRLQSAGAQLITLHGRTRKQGFSGVANWTAIAEVKRALKIPLVANGDINSVNDAMRCLRTTGADGIMLGRGTMGAPWLVGQIDLAIRGEKVFNTPTAKEKIIIALDHLEGLLQSKGNHGLLIARKHMNWTCKGFPGSSNLRHSLLRAKTPSEAKKILKEKLNENLDNHFLAYKEEVRDD